MVNKRREERAKARGEAEQAEQDRKTNNEKERLPEILMSPAEKGPFLDNGDEDGDAIVLDRPAPRREIGEGTDERDTGGQCSHPCVRQLYKPPLQFGYQDKVSRLTLLPWLRF